MLKTAAEEYLGKSGLNIRLVVGNTEQPEISHPNLQATPPAPKKIQNEEQNTPVEDNEDESYYEEQMKQPEREELDIDTSSQAKMIQELFNGKVI